MPSSLVLTRLLTKPLSMQFMPETAPSPFMNYMKNSSTMNCHWYKHLLAPIFINQPLPLQPTNAHHPSNGTLALPIIHLDCYQRPPRTAIPPTTSLNKFPQINLPPLSRPSSNHTPQVNLMHLPTSQSSDWLFDSGASHHITNDLNALSLHSPYDGTDDLVIGDENSRRWFLLCWWPRRSRRLTTFSDLPQYVDCGDCSCVYEFWGAYFCRVMFEETISGVLWSFGFERPRTKLKNKIGDLNVRQKYFIAL
ncbi:unnamed protein product [Lactuca saligna]|uniref:Retrovirus-related Pol polyprotein from transposon RE2 n=1 Tax=Lactuca saligna TaxID=75948 RepID=A0AA35YVM1_LACSI|nr:unnamed protein product [Lactuca saligna]